MEEVEIKWIFSGEVLEQLTPSREKGVSSELERRYRREGARFILDASNTLKLYLIPNIYCSLTKLQNVFLKDLFP